ncbi:MAG: adenosine kinase [Chitinispirillaceae bacterium]|jgi:sugar/nucleoside kinase (ribokinase family)
MSNNFFNGNGRSRAVAGVGSALVDICVQESESFIEGAGARKGGMTLVESARIATVLEATPAKPSIVPGGSACNTMLGLGKLGATARFIGKRGKDAWGALFEAGVRDHQVEPLLFTSSMPTGHVLSIITPDAQRSMLTYLGASAETEPSEITPDLFRDMALVHLEGYLLFNRDLMMAALIAATSAGAKVSLDLASYTVIEASLSFLPRMIDEYVDIVMANEDEARAYTGYADEVKAIDVLAKHAAIAVIKLGSRGSLIASNGDRFHIDAITGDAAVDTTGAGDLWASGFLYGLLNGYPLEKCGEIGSLCGYEVCKGIGASIPEEGWQRIRNRL